MRLLLTQRMKAEHGHARPDLMTSPTTGRRKHIHDQQTPQSLYSSRDLLPLSCFVCVCLIPGALDLALATRKGARRSVSRIPRTCAWRRHKAKYHCSIIISDWPGWEFAEHIELTGCYSARVIPKRGVFSLESTATSNTPNNTRTKRRFSALRHLWCPEHSSTGIIAIILQPDILLRCLTFVAEQQPFIGNDERLEEAETNW